jgi:hypothetical protein
MPSTCGSFAARAAQDDKLVRWNRRTRTEFYILLIVEPFATGDLQARSRSAVQQLSAAGANTSQLGVLLFGLLQDWEVGVGIFPKS